MPANAAMVCSVHDGSHYRGGKGRFYVPGQANVSAESVSQWSDDFVSTLNTSLAEFLSAVNALSDAPFSGITLGVWHRWLAGVAISPTFRPASAITVQPRICTQRRRLGPTL